jgi:UDP-2-acetamido-3-amino-2,3-dideoxy-glucuronate N-acetyltransferase
MKDKMIALFGAGAWGRNLMRNLHELDVLHSVVDPSPAAQELARELGVLCFADGEAVWGDVTVKGVAVATPAQTHREVVLAAIAAGKDVYVEKPIALDVEDARVMASAASAAGRILMVGHLLQYHPVFEELSRLVDSRELGEVRYVSSSRLNFGRIRSNENVIWSFSPHDISMVLSLVDSPVQEVVTSSHALLQEGIADIGRLELHFANGAFAEIRSSWLSPFKEQKLVVVGDRGMAVFDDREPWERKLAIYDHRVDRAGVTPVAVSGDVRFVAVPHGEPLKAEMRHFIDRIADRSQPRTDADEAMAVLAVLQNAGPGIVGGRHVNT